MHATGMMGATVLPWMKVVELPLALSVPPLKLSRVVSLNPGMASTCMIPPLRFKLMTFAVFPPTFRFALRLGVMNCPVPLMVVVLV